ncbi:MAG: phosphoribosyltransferase [Phycisphaeraceae bacterium]
MAGMIEPHLPYADRAEGGRVVAEALRHHAGRDDLLVLGLPRGGVVTAEPIAEALAAPLDVLVVRKLGVPGREELAMGAIATGGARVLHQSVIHGLGIDDDTIAVVTERERRELERRERLYRDDRPPPILENRCAILVDDGLATGSTMRAAAAALRKHHPARIIVAVPVAPNDTLLRLQAEVDEVVCPAVPEPFFGVGQWYRQFEQTTDEQVRTVLARAWARQDAEPSRFERKRHE